MRKLVLDSKGVSQACDTCGKDLRLKASYTWLSENNQCANWRFCSIACLLSYEKRIPISKINEFIEENEV